MALTKDSRSYIAAHFALICDGQPSYLKSIDGFGVKSDVIEEYAGLVNTSIKHIARPKYDEGTVALGMSISKPMHAWIKAAWDKAYIRKDTAVVAYDFNFNPITVRNMQQCLITEVTLPACDAAAKEPAYLSLKFKPEITRWAKDGDKPSPSQKPSQKNWVPQNYILQIKGYEKDLLKVNKIEALTTKCSTTSDDVGSDRDGQLEPAKLSLPNLSFTIAESHSDGLSKLFHDFVIVGNCEEKAELDGSLQYTSKNSTSGSPNALMTVNFFNLGIFSWAPEKLEAGAETIKRVKFEFYLQKISLDEKYTAGF